MTGVSDNSKANSAQTSSGNPRVPDPTKIATSAGDFLDQEAERARQAIFESLKHAADALSEAIDPRQLTKKHPLLTVTSVIVAGFAAAVVAIPSKREQELRRLERLRRAMEPRPDPKVDIKDPAAAQKGPVWVSLVHELVQLARPLLTAVITSQLSKGKTPDTDKVDPAPASAVG